MRARLATSRTPRPCSTSSIGCGSSFLPQAYCVFRRRALKGLEPRRPTARCAQARARASCVAFLLDDVGIVQRVELSLESRTMVIRGVDGAGQGDEFRPEVLPMLARAYGVLDVP